jgi:hypothetical protein
MDANKPGKDTPAVNFPGFDYAKGAIMDWMRLIGTGGTMVNNAWGELLNGNFGFRDMMKMYATLGQRYVQTLDGVIRGPFRTPAPKWEYFYYELDAGNAVYRTLTLPPGTLTTAFDGAVDLKVTPLQPIGGGEAYDGGIDLASVPDRPDSFRITLARMEKLKPGQYQGFIYKPNVAMPPLFALMLIVSKGGSSTPSR